MNEIVVHTVSIISNIQIPYVSVTTPITTNNISMPTLTTTQTINAPMNKIINAAPMHKIGSLLRAFEKHLFFSILIVALFLVMLAVVVIIYAKY
ncbi:hypothetical protein [Stygiolobus sp. CP859M]|uniref:hypothetical protein n=1 Tax=Stygiolobus sp. CP859M TaxID=3133135 RepID=UPI00307D454E